VAEVPAGDVCTLTSVGKQPLVSVWLLSEAHAASLSDKGALQRTRYGLLRPPWRGAVASAWVDALLVGHFTLQPVTRTQPLLTYNDYGEILARLRVGVGDGFWKTDVYAGWFRDVGRRLGRRFAQLPPWPYSGRNGNMLMRLMPDHQADLLSCAVETDFNWLAGKMRRLHGPIVTTRRHGGQRAVARGADSYAQCKQRCGGSVCPADANGVGDGAGGNGRADSAHDAQQVNSCVVSTSTASLCTDLGSIGGASVGLLDALASKTVTKNWHEHDRRWRDVLPLPLCPLMLVSGETRTVG